jgi:branched-chain amino acid aminotransferase
MPEHVFINGKYLRPGNATVSIESAGFMYGDGLFETIKCNDGEIFNFNLHLERLFFSLRVLRFNPSFTAEYIKTEAKNLLARNNLLKGDAVIKIIIARKSYTDRFRFNYMQEPDLIITAKRLKGYPQSFYKNGIKLKSSSIIRTAMRNEIYRHKMLNYFENIYAKNEAYDDEAQEAVFLTRDRVILEGASSNIFIIKNNMVLTPSSNLNILPGITRKIIIDICRKNRIRISERKLHYFNITEADEMFVTNSIMGVMPVCMFDTYKIGNCKIPGRLTENISKLYREKYR